MPVFSVSYLLPPLPSLPHQNGNVANIAAMIYLGGEGEPLGYLVMIRISILSSNCSF